MIKTRIIPTLLYKNYGLVKGVRFDSWRRVGSLLQSVKVYSMRGVDELIFLDISATLENRQPDFELIDDFADECFMPLTVGGGIKTVDDVRLLLKSGADKVAINSQAMNSPDVIKDAAKIFGSQCIVVSIDVKKNPGNQLEVCIQNGTLATGIDPETFARKMEDLGAGEILLTSIDRDGTMLGYDLELIRRVTRVVSIPVIASGGAGPFSNMLDALTKGKASALAAASIFHFTEVTPMDIKKYLVEQGIPVRI
jgi:imidazole glycerol-phosphate synthase subunit HisF